jgi:hypothetical protein
MSGREVDSALARFTELLVTHEARVSNLAVIEQRHGIFSDEAMRFRLQADTTAKQLRAAYLSALEGRDGK